MVSVCLGRHGGGIHPEAWHGPLGRRPPRNSLASSPGNLLPSQTVSWKPTEPSLGAARMGFLQNGSRESRGGGALKMPTSLPSWGSSWGDVSPESLSRPAAPYSRAFVNNRSPNRTEAAWNVLCLSVLPRNHCATTGIHSRSPSGTASRLEPEWADFPAV